MTGNAPADGRSRPLSFLPRTALRLANKAFMDLYFRREVEGLENIPASGSAILAPTHQSMWDATLVDTLTLRDVRYMAAEEQFQGLQGKAMTWGGAFPVDRHNPSSTTLKHSIEVVKDGNILCMFPEGGIRSNNQVAALKPGVGQIAARADAECIIPVAIHFQVGPRATALQQTTGLAAAATVASAGLALASCGGPTMRIVAGAVTGAMSAAYVAGRVGSATSTEKKRRSAARIMRAATFGAVGAVAGAILGGIGAGVLSEGAAMAVAVPTGLVAGVATKGLSNHLSRRPVVKFAIEKSLVVADYVARHGKKDAGQHIVADLQQVLADAKQRLRATATP